MANQIIAKVSMHLVIILCTHNVLSKYCVATYKIRAMITINIYDIVSKLHIPKRCKFCRCTYLKVFLFATFN